MHDNKQIEDTKSKSIRANDYFSRVEIPNPNARKSKEPDFTLT